MARPRVAAELELAKLKCATFHAEQGVDPIGSAPDYDVFLCVEVPLPWERDISHHEPFRSVLGTGVTVHTMPDGRRARPQGLVALPGAEGWTRVLLYERPPGAERGGPYQRREWWLQPDEVEPLCRAVLDCDPGLSSFEDRRVSVPDDVVDLLVCTHGRRDACCGSSGVALHEAVRDAVRGAASVGADAPASPEVRVWRVSHTGGHRFAPTALTFPDGYVWAHLDPRSALGIARRDLDPAGVVANCRGSSSLAGAPAQAADRAALAEVGWSWAESERSATVTAFDRRTLTTQVRVEGAGPDGAPAAYEVVVALDRHIPQVTCGAIDQPEYTLEPTWRVLSVSPG